MNEPKPMTLSDIDEYLDSSVENALRPTIYDDFYKELVALCDKHQVTIAAEDNMMYVATRGYRGDGYDNTAMWMGIPPEDRI